MFKQFGEAVLEVLYPRRCPVCDQIVMPKGRLICEACFHKFSYVHQPVCKRCGKEILSDAAEYCRDCTKHRRSFEYGMALINYEEQARRTMAQIKYKNKRQYLDFFAEAMAQRYGKQILAMHAAALVPVPIHASRRRRRGFNQAELLAYGIGGKLGIAVYPEMLIRDKKTMPQKKLNPQERLLNLEQAFAAGVADPAVESVILVDDIYTTGSTIEACTRTLRKMGIKKVYFLTICIGGGER
ncbi:MAG: ComF family protein [Hungatella sp.]